MPNEPNPRLSEVVAAEAEANRERIIRELGHDPRDTPEQISAAREAAAKGDLEAAIRRSVVPAPSRSTAPPPTRAEEAAQAEADRQARIDRLGYDPLTPYSKGVVRKPRYDEEALRAAKEQGLAITPDAEEYLRVSDLLAAQTQEERAAASSELTCPGWSAADVSADLYAAPLAEEGRRFSLRSRLQKIARTGE